MRIHPFLTALLGLATALPLPAAETDAGAAAPAQVMIVGTWHFSNPGQDLHNVESDDVLTPARQAELDAVVDALARFAPTRIAVEWPKALVDERYAAFRAGTLPESRNEVVQLGFRLASRLGLERVDGIDVDGEFPWEAVQQWAAAHGRSADLDALQARAGAITAQLSAKQRDHSIGAMLRWMNDPAQVRESQGFYTELLRYGAGDQQPGVTLNARWGERNLAICARLLQQLAPGDRVVVFYGAGHLHALQRCAIETPGVQWVDALDFLPR